MSLAEILIVLVLLLVVVGPERLPDVARVIGNGLREIRRATNMFRDTLSVDDETFDVDDFNQPLDQPFDENTDETVERDPHALSDSTPHASGGYGRDVEMRTEVVEAPEARADTRRVALEAAASTESIRWIYVPHPHRNILY
ncbi:MAG: twin-arginine translocase TatA/TatE family subunit [Bradymonadaceae bacterium]